ncbi:N,N'-diacetyllegionaminic acid synthase [subsurface metagenome]
MLKNFRIGKKLIGKGKIFIIAEIGSNHNQNIDTAKKLIDVAVEAGADAVKFQSIKYDMLYIKKENTETEKLFEKIQLKEDWHKELFDYCRTKQILFCSAPTYLEAVDILERINVKLYKIASPQTATSPQLIEKIAKLRKPIIMSTGYCTLEEIDRAVKIVEKMGNNKLTLLHCISEYPTNPKEVNIKFIQTLKQVYKVPVGFSDHTLGWEITLAAVAIGADIIEKHITLSRNQKGPDHFFALEPKEFKRMVEDIQTVEESIGNGVKLKITTNETKILNKIRMKAIAKNDISKGAKLNKKEDIIFRRINRGMDAWEIYRACNLIVRRNIKKGEPLIYEYVKIFRS